MSFGGSSPPAPQPAPPAPTPDDPAVKQAADNQRALQAQAAGRGSTLLTGTDDSFFGVAQKILAQRKTLLGA